MSGAVKVTAWLAAASWLVAIVAAIDWIRGNETAPNGIVSFGFAGAVLTVTAVALHRDDRKWKAHSLPLHVAHCTVDQCTTTGILANPGGNWSRDTEGRHFCPAHPAATTCRICGRDKGTNRIICGLCARDESKENKA